MPTVIRRPNSDNYVKWNRSTGSTGYVLIDEETANTSDYIYWNGKTDVADIYGLDNGDSVPDGATINHVKVYGYGIRNAGGGISGSIQLGFIWGSTSDYTAYTYGTSWEYHSKTFTQSPATGEDWTVDEVNGDYFELYIGTQSDRRDMRLSQAYVEIDYSEAGSVEYDSPAVIQAEKLSTPSNCFERPSFRGKFLSDSASTYAHQAWIIVSTSNISTAGVDSAWSSGWFSMAQHGDYPTVGEYCPPLPYYNTADSIPNAGILSSDPEPDGKYYWIMKFKDTVNSAETDWSTASWFKVDKREWADTSYAFRQKITFSDSHPQIDSGAAFSFDFKTGNRSIIADNLHFNEGVQAAGGSQVVYYDNKTHVVYVARVGQETSVLEIYIVTYDHLNEEWGNPYYLTWIDTNYDPHYIPVISVDQQGYLHVFISSHSDDGGLGYIRSSNPNISGSLESDPKENVWESQVNLLSTHECTYPVSWVDKRGIVYVASRSYQASNAYYKYIYSEDNGSSWSSPMWFIYDNSGEEYKTYCYGFRYDEKLDRLHLAYTFNRSYRSDVGGYPRGIWYAYSDYDENYSNRGGFKHFYSADGTLAGLATANVSGVESCLNQVSSSANACAVATCSNYDVSSVESRFITDMLICKDGNPLVFWEQKFDFKFPYNETNLQCAKWNGSSWDHSNISHQTNLKQQIRRSGIGGYVDNDGEIDIYFPVFSKTSFTVTPTYDYNTIGVEYSNGTDAYALLDDEMGFCDTSTWIKLNQSGDKIDLMSTVKMEDTSDVSVVGMEIEAICALSTGVSSGAQIQLTTYDSAIPGGLFSGGAYIENTEPLRYSAYHTANPYTHRPLTLDSAESLCFGVYCQSDTSVTVYKVNKKIRYHKNSDINIGGSDIYRLSSTSDGLRWEYERITKNSYLGIPIMNSKHSYSGNLGEVIWSSGSDLFYLNSDYENAFGRMQYGGDDIKVYYGNTEISRDINYLNLNKSKVTIPIQENIPENRTAGPQDYYVYYGNKNENSYPMYDLSDIYLVYESFEGIQNGTLIDSTNSRLQMTSGTARGYYIPLDKPCPFGLSLHHTNRVFSGNTSCILTTCNSFDGNSGYIYLDSSNNKHDYSNIYADMFAFNYSLGGEDICLVAEDSAGSVFKVGQEGFYLSWSTGEAWHNTDYRINRRRTVWKFGILVDSAGCSGWYFDKKITNHIKAITQVDKLRIETGNANNNENFIDCIRAYKTC